MGTPIPLFVPIPGGMELVVILGIAVLLFGANKIPALARSSGQAMGEFKRGREELETEIREAAEEPEAATAEPRGPEASSANPSRLDADEAA